MIAIFTHICIIQRVEKEDDSVGVRQVDRCRVGNGVGSRLEMFTGIVIKYQIPVDTVVFRQEIG